MYKYLDKGVLEWLRPQGIFLVVKSLSRSIDYALFDKRIETSYLGFMVGFLLTGLILAEMFRLDEFLITLLPVLWLLA